MVEGQEQAPIFEFRGQRFTLDQLNGVDEYRESRASVLAVGFGDRDRNTVHAFASENELSKWVSTTSADDFFRFARRSIDRVKERGEKGLDEWDERQEQERKQYERAVRKLSRETGLPWPSLELFERLSELRIGTVVMCEHEDYGGRWAPFFSVVPDFRDFNDMMSSYFIFGTGVFYEHTWFGGRALWVGGVPVYGKKELRSWGWDNIASSGWKV